MNANLVLNKIGISQNFIQDSYSLLAVVLLTVVFAIFVGRGRLVSVLISSYITLALLEAVPGKYFKEYSYKLALFFVLLILVAVLGKRIFGAYISGSEFMWRIFVVSFLEVMMLSSIIFSILPRKTALGYISENAYKYLVSSEFHLFWITAPLIFVYLIRKKLN